MSKAPRSIPSSIRRIQMPVGGTLILLMLPDHFPHAPAWIWPVCWTLWMFVWIIWVVDVARRVGVNNITDSEWRKVFPDE